VKVAIVGSRHFPALNEVEEYVRSLPAGSSVVTGSASGVDAAATRAARARGLHVQVVAASFDELRDAARAAERNLRLVGMSDVLVAFWDGRSEGTRRTIDRALGAGKEVHVFTRPPE
jgi:predicted Rossmann fold nucleotide-binding protein DprA/Smf involved in DNA uptake